MSPRSPRTDLPRHPTPWLVLAFVAATVGCRAEEPSRSSTEAVDPGTLHVRDIPNAKVSGTLRGEPFTAKQARFRVERMEGRQRVDVYLADAPLERCGVPIDRHVRRIWLRFDGVTELGPGIYRVHAGSDRPQPSIHYEVPVDFEWVGWRGGAALVLLDSVDADTVRGRLDVVFDDEAASRVQGRFAASSCIGALDVDNPVNGAGLLDPGRLPRAP